MAPRHCAFIFLALAAALSRADEPQHDAPPDAERYRSLVERVAMLEERLRLTNIPEITDDEVNERSLLEQFTDTAGDFVMNRLLPRSDPQCRWNYAKSVCVPRCDCQFSHRPGDLTLSRACRVRPPETRFEDCRRQRDNDVSGERGTFEKLATFVTVQAERTAAKTLAFLREAGPPTDGACDWDWGLRSCAPAGLCRMRFRFGDFHLGRACRLRDSEDDEVVLAAPPLDDDEPEVDAFASFGDVFGDEEPPGLFGDEEEPEAAEEEAPAEPEPAPVEDEPEPEPVEEEEAFASFGLGDDDRDAAW